MVRRENQAERAMAAITAQYGQDLTPETMALFEELVDLDPEELGIIYRNGPVQPNRFYGPYAETYGIPTEWVRQAVDVAYEEVLKLPVKAE